MPRESKGECEHNGAKVKCEEWTSLFEVNVTRLRTHMHIETPLNARIRLKHSCPYVKYTVPIDWQASLNTGCLRRPPSPRHRRSPNTHSGRYRGFASKY